MVAEGTLEEKMLTTLALKQDLSRAALDVDSDVTAIGIRTGIDELKKRLEILLSAKPEACIDESEKARVENETQRLQQRQNMEKAGGNLLQSIFSFVGASLPTETPVQEKAVLAVKASLEQCCTRDDDGGISIKFKLESSAAFENLAKSMAAFIGLTSAQDDK
jgi:hypothetical protein